MDRNRSWLKKIAPVFVVVFAVVVDCAAHSGRHLPVAVVAVAVAVGVVGFALVAAVFGSFGQRASYLIVGHQPGPHKTVVVAVVADCDLAVGAVVAVGVAAAVD